MFKVHEPIGLAGDEDEKLRLGDEVGGVHVHPGGEVYVVEFLNLDGGMAVIAKVLPSWYGRSPAKI